MLTTPKGIDKKNMGKKIKEINIILGDLSSGIDERVISILPIKGYPGYYEVKLADGSKCTAQVFLENEGAIYHWEATHE